VETSGGIQASLAGRYASALFALARDERQIDAVGRSLDALASALVDSKDFAELVASPLVSREQAGKAFAALASELALDPTTTNFLGVLAKIGRKGELRYGYASGVTLDVTRHRAEGGADPRRSHAAAALP
jgi:F-type H+-transporting ATPase subunit delta